MCDFLPTEIEKGDGATALQTLRDIGYPSGPVMAPSDEPNTRSMEKWQMIQKSHQRHTRIQDLEIGQRALMGEV